MSVTQFGNKVSVFDVFSQSILYLVELTLCGHGTADSHLEDGTE